MKKAFRLVWAFGLIILCNSFSAHAITLSVNPAAQAVGVGAP
jgi:hypothetical protein